MKYSSIVVILLSICCVGFCQLNPQRLAIVDKNDRLKNYLVRGNLPIGNDQKFQMRELKQHLTNLTGLRKFELIVISFLNFLTAKQTKNRYIQEKFFQQSPEEGQYSTKLILGSLIDPLEFPRPLVKAIQLFSLFIDVDDIEDLITDLHDQIHTSGKNKIVFFHCSAGMDRTGLVSGSYKMKYLNYTMKQVIEENSRFGGVRKFMHFNALNGLKWYCLAIKQSVAECRV